MQILREEQYEVPEWKFKTDPVFTLRDNFTTWKVNQIIEDEEINDPILYRRENLGNWFNEIWRFLIDNARIEEVSFNSMLRLSGILYSNIEHLQTIPNMNSSKIRNKYYILQNLISTLHKENINYDNVNILNKLREEFWFDGRTNKIYKLRMSLEDDTTEYLEMYIQFYYDFYNSFCDKLKNLVEDNENK